MDACLIIHPYTARPDVGFGHDRYAFELLRNLPQTGVVPHALDTGQSKTVAQALMAEPKAIMKLLRGPRPSIYHATATVNAQCAITVKRRPLVTTIHDVLWFFVKNKYDSAAKCYLKSHAIKRAALESDAVIVPFPSIGNFLIDELKVPKERVRVIHHGVDHHSFYPIRPGEHLPRPNFFPRNGRVVLFVGSVTYGKGVDTLIRSFDKVIENVPDAYLVIGSNGWDADDIRPLREQIKNPHRILFSGFIPENELRSAYIHADVMCFPSRYGFGLSTLEAMACGTPTVSGRALDGPEVVADAGLLTDPNDPVELADCLTRLLNQKDLHDHFRKKGIENANLYRWEKTAEETAKLYKELVA